MVKVIYICFITQAVKSWLPVKVFFISRFGPGLLDLVFNLSILLIRQGLMILKQRLIVYRLVIITAAPALIQIWACSTSWPTTRLNTLISFSVPVEKTPSIIFLFS